MLSIDEIKQFINDDEVSERKKFAKTGQRYYDGDNDIKDYRMFYYNADGELVEDTVRANTKIPHNFMRELVDQAAQYILSGKEGYMRSDIPELQEQLDIYFNKNEDFTSELMELLTGCMIKGFEYMYAYKNENNKLAFECADGLGVVEVRAKDADDNCEHIIYWYIDRIEKGRKKIKRIQVWDEQQTYFYTQVDDGEIQPDDSVELNPRPHIILEDTKTGVKVSDTLGFMPFWRLDNNRKQFSDLRSIKPLIDDYDIHACSLSNNLIDFDTPLHVVRGFEGDNLTELQQNLKTKKVIGVGDSGGVDVQTVQIPYEARKAKLDIDEQAIYKFGFGLNTAGLKDTAATTNIAIKAAYSLLDLKANKLVINVKKFLRKILKPVLDEINEELKSDYQLKDVDIEFEYEVMSNSTENAQIKLIEAQEQQTRITTILNIGGVIGDEEALKAICDVMDMDFEELKGQLALMREEQATAEDKAQLQSIPTEEEPPLPIG